MPRRAVRRSITASPDCTPHRRRSMARNRGSQGSSGQGGSNRQGGDQGSGTSGRGFGSMDDEQQRDIGREGGESSVGSQTRAEPGQFTGSTARAVGRGRARIPAARATPAGQGARAEAPAAPERAAEPQAPILREAPVAKAARTAAAQRDELYATVPSAPKRGIDMGKGWSRHSDSN
jgi:hypothetical protein